MADTFGQLGSVSVAVIADLAGLKAGFEAGRPLAGKYGQQFGALFSGEFSKTIGNINLKSFQSSLQSISERGKSIGASLTAGLTVPLIALGGAAFASSLKIDEAMDNIRAGTGATGKALEGLGKDFKAVLVNVPNSVGDVATAITDLSQRTGKTGPALQTLATQLLNVSRLTKTDISTNVKDSTRLFEAWSVATENQASDLDFLFKASQQTGIGFSRLSELLVEFKVPLQQLGFGFKESAALLGQFEKAGVNTEQALSAMGKALSNFSKAGAKDAGAVLGEVIRQIKTLDTEAANAVGIKVFGERAGKELVDAIKKGRLEVDSLVASLDNSSETIEEAANDTLSFTDKIARFGNKMLAALSPVGDALSGLFEEWIPVAEKGVEVLAKLIEGFGALPKWVQGVAIAGAGLAAAAGPTLFGIGLLAGAAGDAIGGLQKLPTVVKAIKTFFGAAELTKTAGEIAYLGTAGTTAAGGIGLAATATKLLGLALNAIPWIVIAGSIIYLSKAVYDLYQAEKQATQAAKDAASADDILAEKLKKRGVNLRYIEDSLKQGTITQQEYHQLLHDEVEKLTRADAAAKGHADAVNKGGKAAKLSAEDQAAYNKALADHKEKADAAKKAQEEFAQAAARFNVEVARQKEAITGIEAPTDEFVHALHELDDQGKLDAVTILRLRDEINRYKDSNDPLIQKLRQELIPSLTAAELSYTNLKDAAEQLGAVQRDLSTIPTPRLRIPEPPTAPPPLPSNLPTERTVKSLEELKRLEKVPAEVAESIRQMQEAGASAAEIIEVMGGDIEEAARVSRDLGIPLEENTRLLLKQVEAAKESAKAAEDWRRVWSTAVGNIVSEFSDGVTDMITSGKEFSVKLKSIFTDLGKSLIKILVTDAFSFIAKQFSGLISGLFGGKGAVGGGGLLSNVGGGILSKALGIGGAGAATFGGTALGGTVLASGPAAGLTLASAGTTVGGIAGGGGAAAAGGATFLGMSVATAIPVIGGAIAAALVASHYIGQGRRTANEFVQGAQNPFGENLKTIVDAFNEAVAAGKITAEQAAEAKDEVMKLWTTFREEADKFAAQGSTQAKVVRQAYETLDPLIAQITKDMDSSIETLKQKEAVAYKEALKTQVQQQHDAIDLLRKEIEFIRTDPSFNQDDPVVKRLLEELTDQLDELTGAIKQKPKIDNQKTVLEELQARKEQIQNLKEQIAFLKKISKGDPVAQKLLAELKNQLESATALEEARKEKPQIISLQMLRDAEDAAYAKGFGVGQKAFIQKLPPREPRRPVDENKKPVVEIQMPAQRDEKPQWDTTQLTNSLKGMAGSMTAPLQDVAQSAKSLIALPERVAEPLKEIAGQVAESLKDQPMTDQDKGSDLNTAKVIESLRDMVGRVTEPLQGIAIRLVESLTGIAERVTESLKEMAQSVASFEPRVSVTQPTVDILPQIDKVIQPTVNIQPVVSVEQPSAELRPEVRVIQPDIDLAPQIAKIVQPMVDVVPQIASIVQPVVNIVPVVHMEQPVVDLEPKLNLIPQVVDFSPVIDVDPTIHVTEGSRIAGPLDALAQQSAELLREIKSTDTQLVESLGKMGIQISQSLNERPTAENGTPDVDMAPLAESVKGMAGSVTNTLQGMAGQFAESLTAMSALTGSQVTASLENMGLQFNQSLKDMAAVGAEPIPSVAPMTISVTSSYSPTLSPTIVVNGKEMTEFDIRTRIIPEFFTVLQSGVRGYQQELAEVIANRLKAVTSNQAVTGI